MRSSAIISSEVLFIKWTVKLQFIKHCIIGIFSTSFSIIYLTFHKKNIFWKEFFEVIPQVSNSIVLNKRRLAILYNHKLFYKECLKI